MGKRKLETVSQDVLESIIANPSVDKVVDTVRYTAKELASEFGCDVKTVHRYANKLYGKGVQGKVRYYTPTQKSELLLWVIVGREKNRKVNPEGTAVDVDLSGLTLSEYADKTGIPYIAVKAYATRVAWFEDDMQTILTKEQADELLKAFPIKKQPCTSDVQSGEKPEQNTTLHVPCKVDKAVSKQGYTAKELATQFGCDTKTIWRHAIKLFGLSCKGVTRVFDDRETTILLESLKNIKQAGGRRAEKPIEKPLETTDVHSGFSDKSEEDLNKKLSGVKTDYTPILRLKLIREQRERLLQEEAEILQREIDRLKALTVKQGAWIDDTLKANQQLYEIAEAGGLITSDKEDTEALYKRGKKAKK